MQYLGQELSRPIGRWMGEERLLFVVLDDAALILRQTLAQTV